MEEKIFELRPLLVKDLSLQLIVNIENPQIVYNMLKEAIAKIKATT